ncbi:hypothetical protein [Pseudomonas sp. PB101]|nr:hypothetical protein [Pseudomonas sp. PB101]
MSYSIFGPIAEGGRKLPLCLLQVPACFTSPATIYVDPAGKFSC